MVVLFPGVMRRNPVLTELSLCACDIGDEGGQLIAQALEANTTLTQLSLEVAAAAPLTRTTHQGPNQALLNLTSTEPGLI